MTDLNFIIIGQKIKERRQAVGITQEAVANALDINPSHISNIECGRANPSLTALVKIANVLQCSVDYFISEEYTTPPSAMAQLDTLDSQIMEKVKYLDLDTKQKLLKILNVI